MKTITKILLIISVALFSACEGPMGPPGFDGEDGEDGTSLLGTIFQTTVDFTPENKYHISFEYPDDFEIYTSDVVMVYILWRQDIDNGVLDVWRALPQTVFLQEGVIQYNFDYTVKKVAIFIEETVGSLIPAETENQTFRIAVIPAAEYEEKSIELENFNSVLKSLKINAESIKKIPTH